MTPKSWIPFWMVDRNPQRVWAETVTYTRDFPYECEVFTFDLAGEKNRYWWRTGNVKTGLAPTLEAAIEAVYEVVKKKPYKPKELYDLPIEWVSKDIEKEVYCLPLPISNLPGYVIEQQNKIKLNGHKVKKGSPISIKSLWYMEKPVLLILSSLSCKEDEDLVVYTDPQKAKKAAEYLMGLIQVVEPKYNVAEADKPSTMLVQYLGEYLEDWLE